MFRSETFGKLDLIEIISDLSKVNRLKICRAGTGRGKRNKEKREHQQNPMHVNTTFLRDQISESQDIWK